MITLSSIPIPHPSVTSRVMVSEAVLVHPGLGEIKVINAVGAFLWERMDGQASVSALVAAVCERYAVERESAERDTMAYLESLLEAELIQIKEGGEAP